MATLDGMVISQPASGPTSGGAFPLDRRPRHHGLLDAGDGWTVDLRSTSKYVVARHKSAARDYETALRLAFDAAQRGLDRLSVGGGGDHAVVGAQVGHLAWWVEDGESVLRIVAVATLTVEVPPLRVVITNPDGTVVPERPPAAAPKTWHPSFRYFRLSQTSEDLVESFRSLWLATESILDAIEPFKGGPEKNWLLKALGVAHARVDLAQFLPPGTSPTEPADEAYRYFYDRRRKLLFHSKASRTVLLPHDAEAWESLSDAHRLLSRLYLRLVDNHLQVTRRFAGGIFQGFFRRAMDPWEGTLRLHATDDDRSVGPNDTTINRSGAGVVPLTTRPAPELDRPWLKFFLGSAPVADLAPLSRVSQIVAEADGDLVAYENLEGRLDVNGLDRLEAVVGLSARNASGPRDRFQT